jgi:hypothetical protein
MLELVKGHPSAKTIDTGVFIVIEQAYWRLSIFGEAIFTKIFDTSLSFVSEWAVKNPPA